MRRSCTGMVFLAGLLMAACSPQTVVEVAEQPASTIGYPSVAAALSALEAQNDMTISVQDGWTIVTEPDGLTVWSFAPSENPAFPAVAKRVMFRDPEGWKIEMDILCEADKESCDQFFRDFEALNEEMRRTIEQEQQ